jgi:hypothetical protein
MSYFLLYFKETLSRYELDIDEQYLKVQVWMGALELFCLGVFDLKNTSSRECPLEFFLQKKLIMLILKTFHLQKFRHIKSFLEENRWQFSVS